MTIRRQKRLVAAIDDLGSVGIVGSVFMRLNLRIRAMEADICEADRLTRVLAEICATHSALSGDVPRERRRQCDGASICLDMAPTIAATGTAMATSRHR